MRHAARRDHSERAIIEALEAVGAFVFQAGPPFPFDLVVWFRETWYVGEVKTGKGKLTDSQKRVSAAINVPIWRLPEEALRGIGAMH